MKISCLNLSLALISSMFIAKFGWAQCNLLPIPIPGISLVSSFTGTLNRSGLVYHPIFQQYYSVNAGSPLYYIDTFDEEGTRVDSIPQGFDYRGLWYNPENGQLEGNGFEFSGVFNQSLNLITGLPNGTGNQIFPDNQPNPQSCGVLNTDQYEIVYYDEGQIYRYDREDNSFISSHTITGLPNQLDLINTTSLIYTGCPNHEYGVLEHQSGQLYLLSAVNFTISAIVQLPTAAVTSPAVSYKMAYTNEQLWLYDGAATSWRSYRIFDGLVSAAQNATQEDYLQIYPNPAHETIGLKVSEHLLGASMRILNAQGQLILKWTQTQFGEQQVDISSFSSGMYVLVAENGAIQKTYRFIKR